MSDQATVRLMDTLNAATLEHIESNRKIEEAGGLFSRCTLRDWFAGQALVGRAQFLQPGVLYPDCIARECYLIADAMLKARGGTP